MAPPTAISPEILAAARELQAPPEELGVREAAKRLGVSKSALGRALAPKGGRKAPPKASRLQASPRPRPAPVIAHPVAPPRPAVPAPLPRLPAPPPAALAADPVVELLAVAAELRGRMVDLPAGSAEFRQLAGLVRQTLKDADAMQAKRPPKPSAEEREDKARPRAEEVLGKVRSGVRAWAQRDAETGTCCRCGQDIPPELVQRRRAEAGLDGNPPLH